MKVTWQVMAGLATFLLPWTLWYGLTTDEYGGRVALTATVAALGFLGAYLYLQARRVGALPADHPDIRPEDAAGEVGAFPSRSAWPAVMGTAAALIAFGLVFSPPLALPGVLLLLTAAAGYAAEVQRARRGTHRRV
ncbi:MAG: aa3-type cytochrome oxidase subunit IV [Acidimicrobiia bacterium]